MLFGRCLEDIADALGPSPKGPFTEKSIFFGSFFRQGSFGGRVYFFIFNIEINFFFIYI